MARSDEDKLLELRALLGAGGMGEVHRAWDPVLKREVAAKILKPSMARRSEMRERFETEARLAAGLQHPGILAVYGMGTLPDGRTWFTMPEVHGPRLTDLIVRVHAARTEVDWPPTRDGWTLRRLVEVYHRVCQAMAYAHERGVLHRDLKPDNVMVGSHGEVWVLDWGLALGAGQSERPGAIAGTPEYMAPEQAAGHTVLHGPHTDVYALGATLFHVLTGEAPYAGRPQREILDALKRGGDTEERHRALTVLQINTLEPTVEHSLDDLHQAHLPGGLRDLCARAMERDPTRRFPDAARLAQAVGKWLSGQVQRDRATTLIAAAKSLDAQAQDLVREAQALDRQAKEQLALLHPADPAELKRASWSQEDRAQALMAEAAHLAARVEHNLEVALQHAPEHLVAHRLLAERLQLRHRAAEQARNPEADRIAAALEGHALALPEADPVRQRALAWLDGSGTLSLAVDPPHARLTIERFVLRDRRLEPARVIGPLPAPLTNEVMPMGSYRVRCEARDRHPTVVTLHIGRQEHASTVPPGASDPVPVWLPPRGAIGGDECYVPAGWFLSGGDPDLQETGPARRVWVDGFAIHRHPITNAEYLRFLDEVVAARGADAALAHAPREGSTADRGALAFGFDGSRFSLQPDSEGDVWDPDYPVVLVDWADAMAYAAWWADKSGQPWRLPMNLEWEKAARGSDGRLLPWGDHFDASWCWVRESHRGVRLPARIGQHPLDLSPYGVQGLAGNVRDWCLNGPADDDGSNRVVVAAGSDARLRYARGGTWVSSEHNSRSALRRRQGITSRDESLGFRLARSVGPSGASPG